MRTVVLLAMCAAILPAADQTKELPAQAKRGQTMFRSSPKGACSSCHQMEGVGTPAGPDLSKTASALPPRALAMAIRATMTVYVVEVRPKAAEPFPSMKTDAGDFWDLSKNPPELKKLAKGEFDTGQNTKWKHPPAAAGYTNEELADVIAYLRFIGANDRKVVDPEILQ